jgi:hypothetical protein
VDHAAVGAGLAGSDAVRGLEHDRAQSRVAGLELARHGQPEDAAADDREVGCLWGRDVWHAR